MTKQLIHGVAVRPHAAEITTLEKAQEAWEETGTVTVPLVRTEDDESSASDWLLAQLRPRQADLKGGCAVALPTGRAVLRVVELPTSDPEEIDAMVSLQVDKISPFPVEQLQVTCERLAQDQNTTRVLIVAMPREAVEDAGRVFSQLGRYPRWIDIDVLGWWWMLQRDHPLPDSGQDVLVLADRDDTFLIVALDGVPIQFRSLGPAGDMPRDAYCEMIAEETTYTLTSLETEWGASSPTPRFTVWHAGDEPADLVERLREEAGAGIETRPLAPLGPLSAGLAWRAVHRDESMANLAAPEWELIETSRQARRTLLVGTGILLGAWTLALSVFLGALGIQKSRLAGLRERLDQLAEPVAQVREMREKAEFLERYMDASFSALETLRAVSLALPPGVDLSSLTYSKGGTINIRGTAAVRNPIYEFNKGLEKSDLFSEVKLDKVDTVKARQGFRLTAKSGGEEI